MDSTTINRVVSIATIYLIGDANESDNNELSSSSSDNNYSEEEYEDSSSVGHELEILYSILMVGETRGETVIKEKLTDFVERVIPEYTRHVKEHFR